VKFAAPGGGYLLAYVLKYVKFSSCFSSAVRLRCTLRGYGI
jgi:hypothetical protein